MKLFIDFGKYEILDNENGIESVQVKEKTKI